LLLSYPNLLAGVLLSYPTFLAALLPIWTIVTLQLIGCLASKLLWLPGCIAAHVLSNFFNYWLHCCFVTLTSWLPRSVWSISKNDLFFYSLPMWIVLAYIVFMVYDWYKYTCRKYLSAVCFCIYCAYYCSSIGASVVIRNTLRLLTYCLPMAQLKLDRTLEKIPLRKVFSTGRNSPPPLQQRSSESTC
jgi:hypothetical protein